MPKKYGQLSPNAHIFENSLTPLIYPEKITPINDNVKKIILKFFIYKLYHMLNI